MPGGRTVSSGRRIAVVAIHGVADQAPGATVQALADLLIAQAPNGCSYAPGLRSDVTLQVPPLAPIHAVARAPDDFRKRLNQSTRSDFLRENWASQGAQRSLGQRAGTLSQGAEFTDYLLAKAEQNAMDPDTYTARQIGLARTHDGVTDRVDAIEMYWADLSRLSGQVPRILTELFTLLFRLSALGRDTVQTAAAHFSKLRSWRVLASLQTVLDWLYSRVLALLFLQLLMLVLIFVPLNLASGSTAALQTITVGAAAAGLALGIFYAWRRFLLGAVAGVALGGALWLAARAWPPGAAWEVGATWLLILSVFYDWWLRVCEERFRMVRRVGWVLWLITLAAVLVPPAIAPTPDLRMWVIGALHAVEVVLLLIVVWWGVTGPLLVVWLIAGHFATRSARKTGEDAALFARFQARATVATGRLGLVVSLGFFLVLTMAAWALISRGLELSVQDMQEYSPIVFTAPASAQTASSAACPTKVDPGKGAAWFLHDRFVKSTEAFSATAVLLLSLVAYLLVVLTPSALAELELIKQKFRLLGRWLTGGYRSLDAVLAAVVFLGVIAALATGVIMAAYRFGGQALVQSFTGWDEGFSTLSCRLLQPLVITAATATLVLSAAGGLLSKYVPWLRAPLDAALDVDNHLREFPRKAIPRVRIFSRFVAVLRYLASQDYERIVIVSHSQGTVISTELLKYLKERAADRRVPESDPARQLWENLEGRVRLLTAGCPLRQLYAARFPILYDWPLAESAGRMGPSAAVVGTQRWVNAYATGDYVGRWIWSRLPADGDVSPPEIDQVDAAGKDAYETDVDLADPGSLLGPGRERDVSIGAGAHTHYFDKPQTTIAALVDALLAADTKHSANAGSG